LGGQVTTLLSGAAPIGSDTVDFLKIAFACEFIEGMYLDSNSFSKTDLSLQGAVLTAFLVVKD
jgi:hypothetical protein